MEGITISFHWDFCPLRKLIPIEGSVLVLELLSYYSTEPVLCGGFSV